MPIYQGIKANLTKKGCYTIYIELNKHPLSSYGVGEDRISKNVIWQNRYYTNNAKPKNKPSQAKILTKIIKQIKHIKKVIDFFKHPVLFSVLVDIMYNN